VREYGGTSPEQADVIVALGGDGLMLQTLHKFMSSGKPIYGMNRGTIGFLMNEFHLKRLRERLAAAETTITHPLVMHAVDVDANRHDWAINEVSLFRETYRAARLRVLVDGQERLAELTADGVLVATPAGSTAYNLSVRGRSFRSAPRSQRSHRSVHSVRAVGWRCTVLPDKARVTIEVLESGKRPVAAVADRTKFVACIASISAWTAMWRCTCCLIPA
jgi:NAD+ kinase